MRRCSLLVPVVIIALLGLLVGSSPAARATAQDSTPAAGDEKAFGFEGVSFEALAIAPGMTLPSPADLVLVRIGLEPGAVLPVDPENPSLAMVLIESGELTVTFDGPVTITRAGSFAPVLAPAEAGGAFVAPGETTEAGETVTLQAGDVVVFPPNIGGEIRNEGEELAVGLAFIVEPPSSGGAVPVEPPSPGGAVPVEPPSSGGAVPAEGTPEGTPTA